MARFTAVVDTPAAPQRTWEALTDWPSHGRWTPLTRVLAQCQFALRVRREPEQYEQTLQLIEGNAEQLARTVDALVAAGLADVSRDRPRHLPRVRSPPDGIAPRH